MDTSTKKTIRGLDMDRPVFSGITGCGFGKIGQLQHLDTLGKAIHPL
jgi:hypothetical protein